MGSRVEAKAGKREGWREAMLAQGEAAHHRTLLRHFFFGVLARCQSVCPSDCLAALTGNIRASRIANFVEEEMHSDEAPAHAMVIGLEEESIDGGQHTSVRPRKLLKISYW